MDQVLDAYRNNRPIADRLRAVQLAIAESAAELAWLRDHQDEYEGDGLLEEARAITRRVRNLRKLVEVDVAEHRAAAPVGTDPASPEGQQALRLLFDRIVGVAQDVLPDAVAAELTQRFMAALGAAPDILWVAAMPDEPLPDGAA